MLDADRHSIGGNNPPDPIDEAIAPYAGAIAEAENWLDGQAVENEDQMKAVDLVLKDIRSAGVEVGKAEKVCVAPLHEAWKAEKARWKPTLEDLERIKKGLASLVSGFKAKLAQEREAERRAAYAEARRKEQEALDKAAIANAGDIEAQREADRAKEEALRAVKDAQKVEKVKGLRSVTKFEVKDHRAALHWIAKNDREAITAFVDEYVRRNHKTATIDGVNVWTEKEAY